MAFSIIKIIEFNRIFKTGLPYNVLLTDITYLFYGNNNKCYLSTIKDVCNEIKDYIEYYNNYRYQWNLKKMTPVQYRDHLFASIA